MVERATLQLPPTTRAIKKAPRGERRKLKKPKTRRFFWLQVAFTAYSIAAIGQAAHSYCRVEELFNTINSNATDPARFDLAKDKVFDIMKLQKTAPWVIGMFIPCIIASIIEVLLIIPIFMRSVIAFGVYGVVLGIRFLLELIALIIQPSLWAIVPIVVDATAFPIIYHLLNDISEANMGSLRMSHA